MLMRPEIPKTATSMLKNLTKAEALKWARQHQKTMEYWENPSDITWVEYWNQVYIVIKATGHNDGHQ